MKFRSRLLLHALLLCTAASSAAAQATIILQGRVTVGGDQPVSGARVTMTNAETGEVRAGATSANGSYVIVGLQPGNYSVRAQKLGLAPSQRDVRLLVGQRATLDFALQETAVELAGVQITSQQTSTFEVQRTDVSTAVVNSEIENLPLNTRNTLNLAAIVPGIKTFAPTAGRAIPAAGALPDLRFWNFYLDGVEWKSMFNGNLVGIPQTGSPLPQEALREFRVYLNPYDVEFTRGGSYIMSAVTQRGTNETEGSAFLYFQNNRLRALDEFQRRQSRSTTVPFNRVDYKRAQVGFNVRGPVVRNRLFYALSYEQNNIDDAITVNPGRPSYNPGIWDRFRGDQPAPTVNHNGVFRLTMPAGEKHTFDAIYAGRFYDSETFFGGRAPRDAGIAANYWVHSAQLRNTFTPTSSTVNQFSVHMLTWTHDESPLVPGPQRNYPSIFFGRSIFPLVLQEKHFRAIDKFTWTVPGGRHIIEAGADAERVMTSSFLPSNANGTFDYSADTSSLPRQATIAVGINDRTGRSDALAESNGWVTGLYLQDRWQVTEALNLNFGLRYDLEINTLVNDFITPWAQDTTIQRVIPAKYLNGKRKNDRDNLAPRASFSWDVRGDQRTFLRGGWGIMYGRVPSFFSFNEKQASTWRSYTITNPGTNDPDVLRQMVISGGTSSTPNVTLASREIRTPSTNMASLGVGHQLNDNFAVNVDYIDQRSRNLYVNMSVNPRFGTNPRRLTNRFGDITLWDDLGRASFRALTVGTTYDATTDENRPLRASVAYTLGFYRATFEGLGGFTDESFFTMQPTSGDERHRLVLSGMTPLPFGFELSGVAITATPSRFVALLGTDRNSNGLTSDDYVDPGQRAIRPEGGWDVWYRTVDLRLARGFAVPGGEASFSVEVFNLLNTVNWSGYGGTQTDRLGNPLLNYGQPTGSYAPRQLQAGIRYKF